jgi:hypothetical protein
MFNPDLQLVVLHPWQFLPDGLSITRRRLTGPEPKNVSYMITQDERLRATDNPHDIRAPEFPIEPQQTQRVGKDRLNIWLLLLNAHSKFVLFQNRYGFKGLSDDVLEVINLTIEVVELLYEQPNAKTDKETTAQASTGWSDHVSDHQNYNEEEDRDNGGGHESGPSQQARGGNVGNMSGLPVDFQSRCEVYLAASRNVLIRSCLFFFGRCQIRIGLATGRSLDGCGTVMRSVVRLPIKGPFVESVTGYQNMVDWHDETFGRVPGEISPLH